MPAPADPRYPCRVCGRPFTVPASVVARYPGWTPSVCLPCRDAERRTEGGAPAPPPAAPRPGGDARRTRPRKKAGGRRPGGRTVAQVLAKHADGPKDGVFTDGACSGNPGPGGWGAVWVEDDAMREERHGSEPHTTNNRMELRALVAAFEMLPADAAVTVWSDSNLCVRTLNEWAPAWRRRGWVRKTGPVENLDLVRRALELKEAHPRVKLRWIEAHAGWRWNEVADALATAFLRDEV